MAARNKAEVIDRDLGYRRIRKALDEMDRAFVKVGFPQEGTTSGDNPGQDMSQLVTVAAVHEWGAPNAGVPERSFMRTSFDENLQGLRRMQEREYEEVLKGRPVKMALDRLGVWMTGKIRKKIRDIKLPPLKEETVRRKTVRGKRGDNPLIDTAQMINSVQHVVEGA